MMFKIDDLQNLDAQIKEEKNAANQWKQLLEIDKNGSYSNTISNYICYLTESPKYKGKLKYNDFTKQKEIDGKEFDDFDLHHIYNDIEKDIKLSSRQKIDSALMEVFSMNKYNPIVDYLNNVQWDGAERVPRLFINLLEADDTKLNSYMTKIWFIAAVKRIFEPGCKFDNMIVLQGAQGIGKSTICDLLSLKYSNNVSMDEIGNKDIINKLNRTWIAIVDELDSFNKKEMSNIKTFISNTKDTARLAFGKNAEIYPRHCVFIGSTNDTTFLRDNTSLVERRFWVIKCNKHSKDDKIFKTLTDNYINQLWAESVFYYRQDPHAYLDITSDLMNDFSKAMIQFKTFSDDVVFDYINAILEKKYNLNKKGEFNSPKDFLNQYQDIDKHGMNNTIQKIPFSYLKYVLKNEFHEERAGTYIANGLGDSWKLQSIRYNGNICKGIVRKGCNLDLFCN